MHTQFSTIQEPEKRIVYCRQTRDYDAYLDNQFVGSFKSYHQAEVELCILVLDRLRQASLARWVGKVQ